MANTWGQSGTTWSQGDWGQQDVTTIYPSGLLSTSSLGTITAFNEIGWGSDTWGTENWGSSGLSISITGYSITASLGDLAYSGSEEGWGRDEWGVGNWGQNITTITDLPSLAMTAGFGPDGWGISPWEEQVSWGGGLSLITEQITIAALTGIEATGSLGTPTYAFDMINFPFTGPSQIGAGLGVLNINDGADHSQGVGSLLATGSVGSLGHEMAYDLTGIQATGYVGTPTITSAKLIIISTSLLATGSVGSLTIDDMAVGLSGLQATGSVGAITAADMVIGLTGLSATASVNAADISPLGYKDIDITGNTSYTYVTHAG
tara:strand:+ start:360 stop:1316 length:957 start_codon:yes stop_codon:yes gene_type:complete